MAPAPAAARPASKPVAKPSKIRYFKGKAPDAAPDSDSDEDDEDIKPAAPEPVKIDKNVVAGGAGRVIPEGGMKVALRDVKIEGGRVVLPKSAQEEESSEEEESEEEEEEAPKPTFNKPIIPAGDESSEYETDSEEESEEEKKPAFRPVFIRKDQRGMTQEKAAAEAEARIKAEEELQAQRKIDSKDLAGETIRRELAEREITDIQPDVDDTDGVDPAAEFDAWRARELKRLVRDKEAQHARDLEREEIERRRALPEEQRLREDMEYAQATRDKEKGEMGFLQKYYHKGAFHQDDDLLKRDYTAATESAVDMSSLPSVMQVRDFGKRSRTKYTHLVDQDTSQGGWGKSFNTPTTGQSGPMGQGGTGQFTEGCWNCGGPHQRKDCPNNNINDPLAQFGLSGQSSGANSSGYGGGGGGGFGRGNAGGAPQDYGSGNGGNRPNQYRNEGRERRFEEERRGGGREQDRGYDRDRAGGRDQGRDRGQSDRRDRSGSPGRRRDDDRRRDDRKDDRRRDDRDRDRRRDDGDRERDRDRDRRR